MTKGIIILCSIYVRFALNYCIFSNYGLLKKVKYVPKLRPRLLGNLYCSENGFTKTWKCYLNVHILYKNLKPRWV